MCGIVGILKFDSSRIEDIELINFTKSLHHRGPDGSGIYFSKDKKVGLGHTRTSIFDISQAGSQPMSYSDKRYWITFNGEIYNFVELKEELKSLGYIFKNDTDTEVILASYLKWAEQCQFKFKGNWAFAIWDNKEKNLFLSSDRFGTLPLYYKRHKNYFIFASELKAFMSLQSIFTPEFDYGFFLWLGKNHGCLNTFLKDIFILPGGHQININQNNEFSFSKWWRTVDHLVEIPETYEDQITQFKELFFNACKFRLRSDIPITSCLSGGIDSSSVVSAIERINKSTKIKRQNTAKQSVFICNWQDDKNSEKHFANDVILNKEIDSFYLDIDSSTITPDDLIKSQFDNEWIDVDCIQKTLLYKKIRENGFRVSVDGMGPDELLGGYPKDPIMALKDHIWPWSEKERFEDLENIYRDLNQGVGKGIKENYNIKKQVIKDFFEPISTFKKKFTLDRYSLINKSKLIYPKEDNVKGFDHLNSYLYKNFHYYGCPYLLQNFNKLAMANGVVSRAPFLDHDLVTYMFSLSSKVKIGGGFTKKILRDSMKGIVPDSVLNRKDKRGFSSPKNNWFANHMSSFLLDSFNSKDFLNSNIFDGKKIRDDFNNKYLAEYKNPGKQFLRYISINSIINSFNEIKKNQQNPYIKIPELKE